LLRKVAEQGLLPGGDECRASLRRCLPRECSEGGCMMRVVTLAGDLELLRQWFNDKSAYLRILAIQSPT
jgi:hypothetical protein